jgi:hypothetical protein
MSKLTVVQKQAAPTFASFDKFAEWAEYIAQTHKSLCNVIDKAEVSARSVAIKDTGEAIEYAYKSGFKHSIPNIEERFWEESNRHGPSEHYDEETFAISRAKAAEKLALLIDSFPTSNIPNPKAFTALLLEEVLAAEPCPLALESACRHIRRTSKFMPAISEVLTVLKQKQEFWGKARDAAEYIKLTYEELEELHANLKAKQTGALEHKPVKPVVGEVLAPAVKVRRDEP